MTNKEILKGVGLVVVGAVVGFLVHASFGAAPLGGVYSQSEQSFGEGLAVGTTRQLTISRLGALVSSAATSLTSTLTIGSSGDAIARVNAGTCYIRPRATTITASSTVIVECQATAATKTPYGTATGAHSALTGVAENDFVQAKLSTTTANQAWGGLDIIGASASSTQGFIQLIIQNHTGADFTWPLTGSATGTASYVSFDR